MFQIIKVTALILTFVIFASTLIILYGVLKK